MATLRNVLFDDPETTSMSRLEVSSVTRAGAQLNATSASREIEIVSSEARRNPRATTVAARQRRLAL
jgi:hypothetical protein